AAALRRREAVRGGIAAARLRFEAPPALARRLLPEVRPAAWPWTFAFAAAALTAALVLPRGGAPLSLADELVAGHVRSLQVEHLVDVRSSDRHTVKPWLAARLDYAPPVPDLAADGFPLAGGRLDYAAGRPVAALVYRRREHVINLFLWPSDAEGRARDVRGFHVLPWREGPLSCWAVSDLSEPELRTFGELWRAKSRQ
ncbi:MAG TPA: anti-sigma factor, partial [Elusimicrobiota bacterium]|nr:anti-sigma factor [Elusimicrobiota bacterium]